MPRLLRLSTLARTTAILFIAAGVVSPISGCQSGGLGGLMNQSAMELLTPMVKNAANSYVNNLTALTSSLGNLKDLNGVMEFVKKAEPMVKEVSSSYTTLSNTTGEERANLMKAFGPKIDSANSGFLKQSDSAKSTSGMWAPALSPVLDKVKLFK